MSDDLMDNGLYGGNADDYNYDAEDAEDNEDNFFAGGNPEDTLYKLGGAKQENENTFCVESANVGSYQGGRFVSTSAYNASKKAATAIFKHIDKEMGITKQDKGKAAKGAKGTTKKQHVKKIEFVLYRHDKKKPVKYYKYEAERVQADVPVVVDRVINKGTSKEKKVRITFSQKVSVHPLELDAEYVERNKEEQKIFSAKKRAAKRKEEAAANPEKKQRKPKAAAKAKPSVKKTKKVASIEDVIKALSVPSKKTEKKSKAEKKAKDAKKPKKVVKGGGFCSFF